MTLLHTRQGFAPPRDEFSGKVGASAFGFFSARDEATTVLSREAAFDDAGTRDRYHCLGRALPHRHREQFDGWRDGD